MYYDIDYIEYQDPFAGITKEHVQETTLLWELRHSAYKQSQHNQTSVEKIEQRLHRHIHALQQKPEQAWAYSHHAMEQWPSAGEVFTASLVALKSQDSGPLDSVIETTEQSPDSVPGLCSAVGFLPEDQATIICQQWLNSDEPHEQYLGMYTASLLRYNPGKQLTRIVSNSQYWQQPRYYARALRLVGELKRHDLSDYICYLSQSSSREKVDTHIIFWANWAAMQLGVHASKLASSITPFIVNANPYQHNAIDSACRYFQRLQPEVVQAWIEQLQQASQQTTLAIRPAIQACQASASPVYSDWLIEQMQINLHARYAFQAYTHIAGGNRDDICREHPPSNWSAQQEAIEEGGNDALRQARDLLKQDDALPWPRMDKVHQHWQAHRHLVKSPQRYLLGQEISVDVLQKQLQQGKQKQRRLAALELSFLQSAPLINTAFYTGGKY